jgi:esterase/lipase superfamily enzyme
MPTVFFATNRNRVATSVPNNFGTDFNPDPFFVSFGRARVRDIAREGDLSDQNITIDSVTPDAFAPELVQAMLDGPDHLILSIHGFDYRFREAVMRSAWLGDWFGRGAPAVASTQLLFSWPSLGSLTTFAYEKDWASAGASGGAFRLFFQSVLPLIRGFRAARPGRRVTLMAHSMGNHALAAGLQATLGTAPGQYDPTGQEPIFDRALLIAADEDADALSRPEKLAPLLALAGHIYVYYNEQDVPLSTVSRIIHRTARLGISGPPDKPAFSGRNVSFVNCSAANPEDLDNPADLQRHQYYRLIPEVRDDLCGVMCCGDDTKLPNRRFARDLNYWRLDVAAAEPALGPFFP